MANISTRWRPLSVIFDSQGCKLSNSALAEYLAYAHELNKHHGYGNTVKFLKELNTRARMFVSGYPKGGIEINKMWVRINPQTCLPRRLSKLNTLLVQNPCNGLLITNMVTLLRVKPNWDISTITGPDTGTIQETDIKEFEEFLNNHAPKLEVAPTPLYPSTKGGPNGSIAVLTASLDAVSSYCSPGSDFQFMEWCKEVRNQKLLDIYEGFKASILTKDISSLRKPTYGTYKLALLHALSDKAGKTRIIYIMDWFRQQLLLPLHETLMEWFRTQEQDATWNQKKAAEDIRQWTEQGIPLYSFDLTAATDRWPRWHQAIVIGTVCGSAWGKVFDEVLSSTKPYNPNLRTWVSYAVGQPMGAFASWAALNISHHMLIRFLANRLGVAAQYRVLGDDVVIANCALAQAYTEYLTKLGVTISQSKSVVNKPGGISSAEFAKHILVNGQVMTPVSPILLKEIYEDFQYWKFTDLLSEIGSTYGVTLHLEGKDIWLPPLVISLLKPLKGYHSEIISLLTFPCKSVHFPLELYDTPEEIPAFVKEHYTRQANPWAGYDDNVISMLYSNILVERLMDTAKDLILFKASLHGRSAGSITAGYLLEDPHHPINEVLNSLNGEIQFVCSQLNGQEPPYRDAIRLMVETDLLRAVLLEGKDPGLWKARKSHRGAKASKIVKQVMSLLKDESRMMDYISFM